MTPEELCAKAADLIEERGLNKDGEYYNPSTNCWCTIGALAHAYDGRNRPLEWDSPYRNLWTNEVFDQALCLVASAAGLETYRDIPAWNDIHATTDQVVAVLRQAANHESDV